MAVTGVLVCAMPGRIEKVQSQLMVLPGIEIHATSPEGRMVVTVEGDDERTTGESVRRIYDVEGILSASIVYNHVENNSAEQESSL